MKRILLVSSFPPIIGGISVSSGRLYDNLIKDGYEVEKFDTRYVNPKYNSYEVLKLLRFMCLPIFLLFRKRFQIIHFHVSGSLPRMYITLFRGFFSRKTRFISTLHGDAQNLLKKKLGKWCVKGFDAFICVKTGDRKVLEPYFNKEIYEIPAFIQPVEQADYEALIPSEVLGFIQKDQKKLITITGSIRCSEKYLDLYGLKTIILSFRCLLQAQVECKLLILRLGNPGNELETGLEKEILEMARDELISDNVLIHQVKNTELWPVLKMTDLFVRPTKTDGDALSLREALYYKVPALASDVVCRPQGSHLYNANEQGTLCTEMKKILLSDTFIDTDRKDSFYEAIVKVYW